MISKMYCKTTDIDISGLNVQYQSSKGSLNFEDVKKNINTCWELETLESKFLSSKFW